MYKLHNQSRASQNVTIVKDVGNNKVKRYKLHMKSNSIYVFKESDVLTDKLLAYYRSLALIGVKLIKPKAEVIPFTPQQSNGEREFVLGSPIILDVSTNKVDTEEETKKEEITDSDKDLLIAMIESKYKKEKLVELATEINASPLGNKGDIAKAIVEKDVNFAMKISEEN